MKSSEEGNTMKSSDGSVESVVNVTVDRVFR